MSEKLVLPRFELPGNGTHRAIRALWLTGCLVVLATLILGLAMWRHRSLEVANAEQAAASLAAARRAAMAPVPVPPVVAKAAVSEAGSQAGLVPGTSVLAAVTPAIPPVRDNRAVTPRGRHHSGKSRAIARASSEAKTSRRSSSSGSNDDVIDRLLRQ